MSKKEFSEELKDIKIRLDDNATSPAKAGMAYQLLLRLVNATIKENQRLNKRIEKLEQEMKNHSHHVRL